ncbi:MAG: proton-conducting transporter transmembrane domain-containing protein [Vulcanimicrobiaceae bacterium]
MKVLSYAILAVPFAAAILSIVLPSRIGRALTAISGVVTAMLIVVFAFRVSQGVPGADALSALFLLPVGIVYGVVGIYTHWYVRAEHAPDANVEGYRREFLVLTNAFACAEAVIPLVTNLAGVWVALEVTTILAALLVRLQGTDGALEAAWKYILIASCGLAIGLVGVIVLYASGTSVLGLHYDPQWMTYMRVASHLEPDAVRIAFILALIGFGTKMGLAPMHTWLPDAHGAGPTPTSAMLSGILLSDALYVILRFASIANAAVGTTMTHRLFFIVGLLSLALGAFFLLRQRDIKRMLAYSSIEHMGVIACGLAFGSTFAVMGALLHAINHSATKSLAFLSAGRLAHRFDTREIEGIRGGIATLPVSGTMFMLASLALAGMPPFGTFRSELMILAGGFGSSTWYIAIVVLALLLVAFAGIVRWATMVCTGERPQGVPHGERSLLPVLALICGFVVVLGLGLIVPAPLDALLQRGMHIVEGS